VIDNNSYSRPTVISTVRVLQVGGGWCPLFWWHAWFTSIWRLGAHSFVPGLHRTSGCIPTEGRHSSSGRICIYIHVYVLIWFGIP